MCVGKALTGGYLTLAATLCTPRIAAGISATGVLAHGPTFMGNPLACAVANASLGLLAEPGLGAARWRGSAPGCGPVWSRCVTAPGVADVRVLGAIGVVQLDHDVDVRRRHGRRGRRRCLAAPVPRPDLHHAAVRRRRRRRRPDRRRDRGRGRRRLTGEGGVAVPREREQTRWRPSVPGWTGWYVSGDRSASASTRIRRCWRAGAFPTTSTGLERFTRTVIGSPR